MIDVQYELEQLNENPEWLDVLATYNQLIADAKKANPEAAGWVNRLREVDGVETDDLSFIHGNLIAHGFLRFQIADRSSGMEYRLSQLGKKALNGSVTLAVSDDEPAEIESDKIVDSVVSNVDDQQPVAASISADVDQDLQADDVSVADQPVVESDVVSDDVALAGEEQETASTISQVEEIVSEIQLAPETSELEIVQVGEVNEDQATKVEDSSEQKFGKGLLPIIDLDELKKSA